MQKKFKFTEMFDDEKCFLTIEMELKPTEKGDALSVCGFGRFEGSRDCDFGGQCLDDEYFTKLAEKNYLVKEIVRLWKAYHLNDMNAGTPKQTEVLDDYFKDKSYDYEVARKVLEENNLLFDTLEDGTKYEYGTSWLYRPIPEKDLEEIKLIISSPLSKNDLEEKLKSL